MKTPTMSNSWSATVLTLFPEMFPGPLGISLLGKALSNGLWSLDVRDIRDHGLGKHRTVDDSPAGGGPGMVMRADVAAAAIDALIGGPMIRRVAGHLSAAEDAEFECVKGTFLALGDSMVTALAEALT